MFAPRFSPVLEVEVKPSNTNDYDPPEDDEEDDQTTDTTSTEEDDEEDASPTDYTAETPEEDEPETVESEEEEELTPNDYTTETPEDDNEEGEEGTGDETEDDESGDPEPSDYTSEDPDGGEGDVSSDTTDETSTVTPTEGEGEEDTEEQKKRELFEDFIALYDLNKEFISKLSSHTVSTIFVNKIMIQISKNLNDTRRSIWNHIMRDFDRLNYVQNLTKYNFFIENLRINVQMVDKVKDYVSKSETFK